MNTVTVQTASPYCVKIGSGLLSSLGQEVAAVTNPKNTVLVTDTTVEALHGPAARKSLEEAGFSTLTFTFPSGEINKNAETYIQLLRFLAAHQITRTDCLVALGGGVAGDLCGFAAATYLRGVPYIQVPTTLLAMVDSSVGGKTAIDLPEGKNLVGAFYQPQLVICDTDTLKTLPEADFRDGCAEVIKYSILFDRLLFDNLFQTGLAFDRESVITACITWKRDVVTEDEYDTGIRQLLNLGHTLGHSIEKASQYQISHGSAVAIGMALAARIAANAQICTRETADNITAILDRFGLPTQSPFPAEVLLEGALSDKKRTSDQLTLILPATIGCCHRMKVPISKLKSIIEAGL